MRKLHRFAVVNKLQQVSVRKCITQVNVGTLNFVFFRRLLYAHHMLFTFIHCDTVRQKRLHRRKYEIGSPWEHNNSAMPYLPTIRQFSSYYLMNRRRSDTFLQLMYSWAHTLPRILYLNGYTVRGCMVMKDSILPSERYNDTFTYRY